MYEHALELDPNNSAAYTGLSNVTLYLVWGNPAKDYRDSVKLSIEYGQRAVSLDDQDSRAHYAVGNGYICLAQHDMAEAHVDQALTLNPGEYHNLCFKGYMLTCTGRHEESRATFEESIRRNPLSPKSCFCGVGLSDYLTSNYADATVMLRRLSGYGYFQHKYCSLAAAHAQLGNEEQATEAVQEYRTALGPAMLSDFDNDSARWHQHISNLYSMLQPEDIEHVFEGLRMAGLPD
jgi:tetratricopeptide (TPR) repeat protein